MQHHHVVYFVVQDLFKFSTSKTCFLHPECSTSFCCNCYLFHVPPLCSQCAYSTSFRFSHQYSLYLSIWHIWTCGNALWRWWWCVSRSDWPAAQRPEHRGDVLVLSELRGSHQVEVHYRYIDIRPDIDMAYWHDMLSRTCVIHIYIIYLAYICYILYQMYMFVRIYECDKMIDDIWKYDSGNKLGNFKRIVKAILCLCPVFLVWWPPLFSGYHKTVFLMLDVPF